MSNKDLTPEQKKMIMGDANDLEKNLDDAVGLEPEKPLYCPPDKYVESLKDKGYEWDDNGIYCPVLAETDEPHYLRIKRGYNKYEIDVGIFTGDSDLSYEPKTSKWSGNDPITSDNPKRNQRMGKVVSQYGKIPEIADTIMTAAADLNIPEFQQITEPFKAYEEIAAESESDNDDRVNEQELLLLNRRHPELTTEEQEIANNVKEQIIEKGLTSYLDPILKKIHIGDPRNIYRKTLMSLNIMRGEFSAFLLDIAESGAGKSHENHIVFEIIIPERYIEKIDNITEASFVRFSDEHEYFLDRKIILFNDKGDEDGISNMKNVLKILKVLITEHEYSDYKSDADGKGWVNKKFFLKVEGVGAVISTVDNEDALKDSQVVNRSLQSRPTDVDSDELLNHKGHLKYKKSIQSINKRNAEQDLKNFGIFLMSLVNDPDEIINPYINIFKRYCKTANVMGDITREYDRQLALFDAYCRINKHECRIENGEYIASQTQVNNYFTDINPENALNPIESDFIEMIMKGNSKDQPLILIHENDTDVKEDNLQLISADDNNPYSDREGDKTLCIELQQCLNAVTEDYVRKNTDRDGELNYNLKSYGDESDITYDILNRKDLEQCNKQLMQWYKIKGGTNSKFPVFFRVNDIQNHYRNYKAFKNVKNVSDMMDKLVNKGYANKVSKLEGYNIYYLTTNCINLKKQGLTKDDLLAASDFLKVTGFYNNKES